MRRMRAATKRVTIATTILTISLIVVVCAPSGKEFVPLVRRSSAKKKVNKPSARQLNAIERKLQQDIVNDATLAALVIELRLITPSIQNFNIEGVSDARKLEIENEVMKALSINNIR